MRIEVIDGLGGDVLPNWRRSRACESGCRPHSQQKELVNTLAPMHCLLAPGSLAKDLLNPFLLALTDGVAGPAGRTSVDGRATLAAVVSRNKWRGVMCAACRYKAGRIVGLVSTYHNRGICKQRGVLKRFDCCVSLGCAMRLRYLWVCHEAMSVISEQVPHVEMHASSTNQWNSV